MTYLRELGLAVCRRANVGATTLMKRVAGLVLLCLLGLHSNSAMADCGFYAGYGVNTSVVTLPGNITVKRDVPIGTIIYDSGWRDGGATRVYCTGSGSFTAGYASTMAAVPGMAHVYATGVPGIGIKTGYSNSYPNQPVNIDAWFLLDWPRTSSPYADSTEYTPAGIYRIQFIATGPISVGVNTMTLPSPSGTTSYGSLLTNQVTFTNPTITVNSVGCVVRNNNIVVPMDTVPQTDFTTPGFTTKPTNFSIDLTCPSGVAVSYQIDGTSPSGIPASSGVIANSQGTGYATGVGVQVRKSDDTTVVPLGTRTSYITTVSDNQVVSIPLVGRYYQAAPVVTGGDVLVPATFTMFYQ